VGGHAFMYMGVRGINIVSYYDIYNGFWSCYGSVVCFVFLLDFGTVTTVWYFLFFILMVKSVDVKT